MSHGEDRPDISRADFTWCRTAIEWGWGIQDTARRLMELSSKAKENGERYATVLTASNAAASVRTTALLRQIDATARLTERAEAESCSRPTRRVGRLNLKPPLVLASGIQIPPP